MCVCVFVCMCVCGCVGCGWVWVCGVCGDVWGCVGVGGEEVGSSMITTARPAHRLVPAQSLSLRARGAGL